MSSARPAVAAVVPALDAALFLGATLRSIVGQAPPVQEIVVVDDGSTDDTAVLARTMCPAATVLTGHRREGATLARARGVAATTAEWLAFCDHDDTWPPGRLAALLAAATPQASWIAGRVHLVVEPGYRPPASMLRADGTHVPYLIGASLIRRSVWDDLGGMEPFRTVGDDVDLYLRFRESGRQPALVDAVTLHLHLRPGTTTSNQLDQVATLTFDAMRAAARRRRHPGASL